MEDFQGIHPIMKSQTHQHSGQCCHTCSTHDETTSFFLSSCMPCKQSASCAPYKPESCCPSMRHHRENVNRDSRAPPSNQPRKLQETSKYIAIECDFHKAFARIIPSLSSFSWVVVLVSSCRIEGGKRRSAGCINPQNVAGIKQREQNRDRPNAVVHTYSAKKEHFGNFSI